MMAFGCALVALGWFREGTETDRGRVGEAVAAAIRDMASCSTGKLIVCGSQRLANDPLLSPS
jgi:hypothetical protein